MSPRNQCDRDAAAALNELSGKLSIYGARDFLKQRGFLPCDEDAIEQWELEQTRRIMQRARKVHRKAGEIQLEWIHLIERLEDGTKADYWRKLEELTIDEGAQHLTNLHSRVEYDVNEFRDNHEFLAAKFGVRKLQRRLPFDIPSYLRLQRREQAT